MGAILLLLAGFTGNLSCSHKDHREGPEQLPGA
jgi:hypothetical protein